MSKRYQLTTSEALVFEDFKRLLKELRDDGLYKWEAYCTASFCTALRVSDVKNTTWRELLSGNDLTKIERKTSKMREIRLGQSFQRRIKELHDLMGNPDLDAPIIVNEKTGEPYTTQYINQNLKLFIWKYKLPIKRFSTHTFRKSFGRCVWEVMGKSAEAITLLNMIYKHSSMQTTMIYLGIRQDEINGIFEQIELD